MNYQPMNFAMPDLDQFLSLNRITSEDWVKADISWDVLCSIAVDHENQRQSLEQSAEFFAKIIQQVSAVHSVRWRIKDTNHLLTKIIRKRIEKSDKYKTVTSENYFALVTDLVGVRALHLFKTDYIEIDQALRAMWTLEEEPPIAYVRTGDQEQLNLAYEKQGFEVKKHPAGYRSVHYVFQSQPVKRKIITEVQVRTIFEEGWSEIDHQLKYPNFSDDPEIVAFLDIFNRLAGSADEMGSFVKNLDVKLKYLSRQLQSEKSEKRDTFTKMESLLDKLNSSQKQDAKTKETIKLLQTEVSALRGAAERTPLVTNKLIRVLEFERLVAKSGSVSLSEWLKTMQTSDVEKLSDPRSKAKKSSDSLSTFVGGKKKENKDE